MLVDPTRSRNMTVIGRRSAPSEPATTEDGACVWRGFMAATWATEAMLSSSIADMIFRPVPDDSDAEVLQVVERQLRQHRAVDLIVPERRLILPKAEVPEPDPDIHRCSLKRAARPMMVPRGRDVHDVGPMT